MIVNSDRHTLMGRGGPDLHRAASRNSRKNTSRDLGGRTGSHAGGRESSDGVRYDAWIERTLPDGGARLLAIEVQELRPIESHHDDDARHRPARDRGCELQKCGPPNLDISDFSGCGPTRDGRDKPDVAAPGELITSTKAGAGPAIRRPRPACQKRARVCRLRMLRGSWPDCLKRNHYLTADEIRKILVDSADRGTWVRDWGMAR